jgi:D-alanyl-D-alanine dipeptidase
VNNRSLSALARRSLALFALLVFNLPSRLEAESEPDLVDIKTIDPTIEVDLRYAGKRNIAEQALYAADMPALVRPSVARRLMVAQDYLLSRGYRLKIWDAYRPKAAHDQLWQITRDNNFVADPADGRGSLHTWGVAVDATLIDKEGREVRMPTDFDDFTPAAMLYYRGTDASIRSNLHRLQRAMAKADFYGLRTEWWHFVAKDWQRFGPVRDAFVKLEVASKVGEPSPQPSPKGRGGSFSLGEKVRMRANGR